MSRDFWYKNLKFRCSSIPSETPEKYEREMGKVIKKAQEAWVHTLAAKNKWLLSSVSDLKQQPDDNNESLKATEQELADTEQELAATKQNLALRNKIIQSNWSNDGRFGLDLFDLFESFWSIWNIWDKKLVWGYWEWESYIMCDWKIIYELHGKTKEVKIVNNNLVIIDEKWELIVNWERMWRCAQESDGKYLLIQGGNNCIVDLLWNKRCSSPQWYKIQRVKDISRLESWKLCFVMQRYNFDEVNLGGWYAVIEWEGVFWPFSDVWKIKEQNWKIWFYSWSGRYLDWHALDFYDRNDKNV